MRFMLVTTIRHFYLPLFCVLALMVYAAQRLMFPLPLVINNHFNDLLCMPIVLKICQYAVRSIKRDEHLTIPMKISVTVTVLYAIYFELLLPKYTARYTADSIDVILYFIGLLFFVWIEGSLRSRHSTSN